MARIYLLRLPDGAPNTDGPWFEMPDLILGAHGEAVTYLATGGMAIGGHLATCAALLTTIGGNWDLYPIDTSAVRADLRDLVSTFHDPSRVGERASIAAARVRLCSYLPQAALAEGARVFAEANKPLSRAEEGNSGPPSA